MSPPALRLNRTPSARRRAASEVFQTPQETPRAPKRKRQEAARALVDLSTVEEGEGGSPEEDEPEAAEPDQSEPEEDKRTEEERMNTQVYQTTWRIVDHRQRVVRFVSHVLTGQDNIYNKVRQWAVIESMKHDSSVDRMHFKVHGRDQPQRGHWQSDIDSSIDFAKVRKKALQVHEQEGFEDVHINAAVYLRKDSPLPETPPATTVSKNKKKKRARLNPTQQQEANADDDLEEGAAIGDYSLGLRVKWTCGVTSCPNNTGSVNGYYYWPTSNTKDGHYPLNAAAVKAWSQEIKNKDSTDEEPSAKVFEMLVQAKHRLLSHSHSHRSRTTTNQPTGSGGGGSLAPIYNNFFGVNPADIVAQQGQQGPIEPPSSAPTKTPPLEVLQALFRYYKDSVS